MVLVNDLTKEPVRPRKVIEPLLLMLAPFAPHLAEELWKQFGHARTLAYEPWPVADTQYLVQTETEYPMQINGKLRATFKVPAGSTQEVVEAAAKALPAFAEWTAGKTIKKVIFVPNKLINFVVG
jgi:leucyl-tRNA synthetase